MAGAWTAQYSFDDILGESESLQSAIRVAQHAAKTDYPTLVVGESGTGKELLAQAIHNASRHRNEPFVAVNCGTLCGEIALAEMCGYEPGSFTGADRRTRVGILDIARDGTLFLDELQDLPATPQRALLRFLETGSFLRVGGTEPVKSQPRVIAASNVPPDELERKGLVRSDLLYRLNCLTIELRPLRERREDLRPIADRCLREELHFLGEVEESFWSALRRSAYHWPGNARGLRNVLLKAILQSKQDRLTGDDLPTDLSILPAESTPPREEPDVRFDDVPAHDAELHAVLRATRNNVSETARRLGIHRSTIYRRLSRAR
jgi:transcriptional regulator with PAS, ATPase and Fis domain